MPSKLDPEFYGSVSAFYLALWDHLDAFSEQSRWFRAHHTPSIQERTGELSGRFEALQKALQVDPVLMSSFTDQYQRALRLADHSWDRGRRMIPLCFTKSKTGKRL